MAKFFAVLSVVTSICLPLSSFALTPAQIEDLRTQLLEDKNVRRTGVTAGYAQLIGFISDYMVPGYVLDVKNKLGSAINIVKFPLNFEVADFGSTKMLVRGGFNYASIDSKNILEGFSSDKITPSSEAYSGLLGVQFAMPLAEGWTLKPALDAGIGRIENDIEFQGVEALQVQPLVKSLVINWSTNVVLANIGLGTDYTYSFKGLQFDAKANYDHTIISSFSESGIFAGFKTQTNLLHFSMDLTHPWNQTLFAYPLFGIIHTHNTTFLGKNSNALGFSKLNGIGYHIKTKLSKRDILPQALTLGFNYLFGDHVEGYEMVFKVDF